MKQFLLFLLFVPFLVSAQTEKEVIVGDMVVQYDAVIEKESSVLYFLADALVLSEHDAVTLVYQKDTVVLEAHDTDGDGVLDAYLSLDENGDLSAVTGEGARLFERPEPVELSELMEEGAREGKVDTSAVDPVGSLDSITIPKYRNWTLYGLVLLFLGGGVWWYRRRAVAE